VLLSSGGLADLRIRPACHRQAFRRSYCDARHMGGGTEHDCLPLNERGLLKPDGLKSESVLFGPAEANVSSDIVCDRPPMMAVGRSRST
jgi:hypothetical protein